MAKMLNNEIVFMDEPPLLLQLNIREYKVISLIHQCFVKEAVEIQISGLGYGRTTLKPAVVQVQMMLYA